MQNLYRYRLPREREVHAGSSCQTAIPFQSDSLIIYPFDSQQDTLVAIPLSEDNCELEATTNLEPFSNQSREDYEQMIAEAIGTLEGSHQKVVMSRKICIPGNYNPEDLWQRLLERYPEAFCFCIQSERYGLWMGASPELLVESDGRSFSSVALAGTRKAGTEEPWDHKNVVEQQIVTDYIREIYSRFGLNPVAQPTFTKRAGSIEHICTPIHGEGRLADVANLLDSLSPTPALCGFPKDKAIATIHRLEPHRRDLYGGFVGVWRESGEAHFYVNLRSMRVHRNGVEIFVGGGITCESKPSEEWNETERKAETMRSILDNQ